MGQAESKESEQNPGHAPQHARRNTVHGTERTRRPTPPIAHSVSKRPTETKRTPAGPSAPPRLGGTPQSFPRSRALTNVRPRGPASAAPQRQAPTLPRTSGRLQQQFAVRPTASSTASPSLPTPSRSQPIPISQPATRSRSERPAQDRARPTRRSAPPAKTAVQATDSDSEPAGPPAKRVTRSRTAVPTAGQTPSGPAPSTSTTTTITTSTADSTATPGPSTSKRRPRAEPPSDDEPTRIGDIEPDSPDDREDKMSMSSASSSDENDSDDAASQSSDSSDDPDGLDLDLDGPEEDGDDQSQTTDEKSEVSAGTGAAVPAAPPAARQRARRTASPAAAAASQFALRRSRRRSVPVRHLQVDPHRQSYVSV